MRRDPDTTAPTTTPRAGAVPDADKELPDLRTDLLGPGADGASLIPRPVGATGLDDQLCFALYAATNAVVRAYRPLLRAVGLTYPQYVILMALWEADDVSVTDLATRVRMPQSGLAPILDRLVDAELVQRQRHRVNRRVVRVTLTDRGRLMEERAVVAQHEVRCQTRLSTGEVEQLRGSLHDLTTTLDHHHRGQEVDAGQVSA